MSADDEAHLRLTASDESLAEALKRADANVEETEKTLDSLGRTGAKAGEEVSAGMDKAEKGTGRARDAMGRFIPVAKVAGDEAEKAGAKAAVGSIGFDKLAASVDEATKAGKKNAADTSLDKLASRLDKLSKTVGGLKPMTMLFKWGSIVAGGQAVIGMLASLGAGAVMAVGRLSPMVGVLGALGPALFLGAGLMGIFKISGVDVGAMLRPLTNDFKAMRMEITQAMLPGIQALDKEIHDKMIPTLKTGLVGMAGSVGLAAKNFGGMVTNARTVSQIGSIFSALNPIVVMLGNILGRVFNIFIDFATAGLPVFTSMANGADRLSVKFQIWADRMTDSGKAQAWMMKAWDQMKSAGQTLENLIVGLYNIFTLAGLAAKNGFGGGLASASQRFRDWTASGQGAATILKFFTDAIPVLKETGSILAYIGRGIASFGSDKNTAALLSQIRTQLLPALGALLQNFTGSSGLGPALISAFSAIASALSQIPLGGLTTIVTAVAALAGSIAWLVANVPGLGPAIGVFLTLWTVAGTGLKAASIGVKAFSWISKATTDSKDLTIAQKALGLVLKGVGPALSAVGDGILWVGRAFTAAWAANPVGIIILGIIALVAIFIWAYEKFSWFHDGVNWVVNAVWQAFVWLAKAAAAPFVELWNIIKSAYDLIARGWNAIPAINVPSWVPVLGGQSFNLPKMPLLAKGGVIEYGTAIVGEQGPEALVAGGKLLGMIGLNGPELRTDLPRGGYVVPSVNTLANGMFHQLPASVADVVATVPGYSALLNRPSAAPSAPQVEVNVDTGADQVVDAINGLAAVLARRPPTPPEDKTTAVIAALLKDNKRAAITDRYRY